MQSTAFSHQRMPHLAVVPSVPSPPLDHIPHQCHYRARPHPLRFAGPAFTLLATHIAQSLREAHVTHHCQTDLFTNRVIDIHLASSVHRTLPVFLLSDALPDKSALVLFVPLFGIHEMYWPQGRCTRCVWLPRDPRRRGGWHRDALCDPEAPQRAWPGHSTQ
jgi:hypothetical protein